MRVLVIDCDRYSGRGLRGALELAGHTCYWAQATDEGLMAAELFRPEAVALNVVVTDRTSWPRLVAELRERSSAIVLAYSVPPGFDVATLPADRRPDGSHGSFDSAEGLASALIGGLHQEQPAETTAAIDLAPAIEQPPPAPPRPPAPSAEELLVLTTREIEIPDIAALDLLEEPTAEAPPAVVVPTPDATFSGTLADTPAWKVLWRLHEEQATGELVVTTPEAEISVFVEKGQPVAATGGGPDTTLGRVLMKRGLLDEAGFRRAVAEQAATRGGSERFGETLMRLGLATARTIERGLSLQVEEKIAGLFLLDASGYSFFAGRDAGDVTRHPQAVPELLMRCLERAPREIVGSHLADRMERFPVVHRESVPAELSIEGNDGLAAALALEGARSLRELLDAPSSTAIAAPLLSLDVMGCVTFLLTPRVAQVSDVRPAAETVTAPPAVAPVGPAPAEPDEAARRAAERINELYLSAKGKNHYEALGLDRDAPVEQIAAACDRVKPLVSSKSVAPLSALPAEMARALELRKLFRAIRQTLTDGKTRAAYDATLPPVAPPESSERKERFQAEKLLQAAAERLAAGEAGAAYDLYAQVRDAGQTEDAEVLTGLGQSLYLKTDPAERSAVVKEAFGLARRAMKLRPQLARAPFVCGEILRLEGKPADSLKFYRHAAQLAPDDDRIASAIAQLTSSPAAAATGAFAVLSTDLVIEGAPTELEDKLRRLLARGFAQATDKHLRDALVESGSDPGGLVSHENRGKPLVALPLPCVPPPEALTRKLLTLPAAFKSAINPHLAKALAAAGVSLSPRVRVALVSGPCEVVGEGASRRLQGTLPTRALMALARDDGSFSTDSETLDHLLGGRKLAAELLEGSGLILTEAPESAGSSNPIFRVAPPRARPAATKKRKLVRPDRPVVASIPDEDLETMQELSEAMMHDLDARLRAMFEALAEAQAPAQEAGRLWKMVAKAKQPDVSKARLRTRLFEPILLGSKIFLGLADVTQWIRLLEGVGVHYTDALHKEAEAFRRSDKGLWKGAKVDRAFADLERFEAPRLYAVSEACRLLGGALLPEESYEDTTFADLTNRASMRLESIVDSRGPAGSSGLVDRVIEIYKGAIDTPDDAIEPVNLFEYFSLLSLLGVTEGIRSYEIDHLSETHKPASAKYDRALESIHESFDEYMGILRKGLGQYKRINRILNLRSPYAGGDETRSMFATRHNLPLYHHIEVREGR